MKFLDTNIVIGTYCTRYVSGLYSALSGGLHLIAKKPLMFLPGDSDDNGSRWFRWAIAGVLEKNL